MTSTSIIRNTKPAVLRNTSKQKYLFVGSNSMNSGSGSYSKTYKLEIGVDCIVDPNDYILMRPEVERLAKQGLLMIVRDIDSEVRMDEPYEDINWQRNKPIQPPDFPREKDLDVYYLRSRLNDPISPVDDTMWFIKKSVGNIPKVDIDWRFRLNGETYSVFDGGGATPLPFFTFHFAVLDWVIVGEYCEMIITHNLNASRIESTIFDSSNKEVYVDSLYVLDSDNIKIRVTAPDEQGPDIDGRFVGYITIIKIV